MRQCACVRKRTAWLRDVKRAAPRLREEAAAAAARGKATSSVIGIKAMGTRFNVLMTIQLPVVIFLAALNPLLLSPAEARRRASQPT